MSSFYVWKAGVGWAVLSFLLVVGLVAAFVSAPQYALVMTVALVAVACVIVWPPLSIIGIVSVDGLGLVLQLMDVDRSQTGYGSFGLLVISAVWVVLRSHRDYRHSIVILLSALLFLIAYGVAVAQGQLSNGQIIAGVRLIATPVLCGLVGLSMNVKDSIRFMRFCTVIVVVSCIAALAQKNLGVAGLVYFGLDVGTSVRTFEGVLRAPGLFLTNYSLGAFAGVIGALALVWWPTFDSSRRSTMWRVVAVSAAVGCLYMSIYRSGILVFAIAILAWVAFGRGKGAAFRKLAIFVSAGAGIFAFFRLGFGSSSSLYERLYIWQDLLSVSPLRIFGYGVGYSGAASASRLADVRITVDNYFLNLLLQFGAAAVLLVFPLLVLAVWMTVRSSTIPILRSGMVLLACMVAFLFVDYWEYTSAMSSVLCAVGIAFGILIRSKQGHARFPSEVDAMHHESPPICANR